MDKGVTDRLNELQGEFYYERGMDLPPLFVGRICFLLWMGIYGSGAGVVVE